MDYIINVINSLVLFFQDKFIKPIYYLFLLLALGTLGFYFLTNAFSPTNEQIDILDSLYFSVISLTTVGYGDNLDLLLLDEPGRTYGIVFTVSYLLVGYGVLLWAFSTVIANFVGGTLSGLIKRRDILRKIEKLKNHIVLCGIGKTGITIITELIQTNNQFVLIDIDESQIEHTKTLSGFEDMLYIVGDPAEEDILKKAGIERARGIICNLADDKENVFLTLTSRSLNKDIRIVSRAYEQKNRQKLIRAGTNRVVFPSQIGAFRMVSEMIRPTVVTFLDKMLREGSTKRVSEVTLSDTSKYVGQALRECNIYSDSGLNVVAIFDKEVEGEYVFNPSADYVLKGNTKLVVIGDVSQIEKLEHLTDPKI